MRSLRSRWTSAILVALMAVGVLSGCGHDDPAPTHTKDGLTVPGTHLRVGQTATVERTDGTAVFDLTITKIERGNLADLHRADYKNADHDTPYYVRATVKVVSGDASGVAMHDYLSAWVEHREISRLITFRPYPPCLERGFPLHSTSGSTIKTCLPYLVDPGSAPIDTVRFINNDKYGNGDGTDIQWKQ